jgi:hypothetical protein
MAMAAPVILIAGAAILSSITLVELHGPGGQIIWVNPAEVTDVREPTSASHFARGTRCLVYFSNRNFITVTEDCIAVKKKLIAAQP